MHTTPNQRPDGRAPQYNHLYKSVCRGRSPSVYLSAEGKALREQYQWEARAQWKGKPLEGDIEVSIKLYFGTKRRADLDNFNKLSLDALTGIGYLDDSQIAKLTIERGYDKARPRIKVNVK
jgi:Holliday junction resolvase RusA-like endonuclease